MQPDSEVTFITRSDHAGMRLDLLVALKWACSRHLAALRIKSGAILVNNRQQKPSYKVNPDEQITYQTCSEKEAVPPPAPACLPILFEDDFLMVINKPPGLVVHPAPGHEADTLVNSLLHHCPAIQTAGDAQRPGIVHRLDRDTSGVLVVAKDPAAHQALSGLFKSRKIDKTYLAVVHGHMQSTEGVVTLPIGRHTRERKKMSVASPRARTAETRWRVRKAFADASLLELEIRTGRTHQIRVHCAALTRPVVGDRTYGCKWTQKRQHFSSRQTFEILNAAPRQMLHAWKLTFAHPMTGHSMRFTAPVCGDIKELLHKLKSAE